MISNMVCVCVVLPFFTIAVEITIIIAITNFLVFTIFIAIANFLAIAIFIAIAFFVVLTILVCFLCICWQHLPDGDCFPHCHQRADNKVLEDMKIILENAKNGFPMLIDDPVEKMDIPFNSDDMNSNGHGDSLDGDVGSSLHVKQTEFAKNLIMETDLAHARQQQIAKMKLTNIQGNVAALDMHKTFQEMAAYAENMGKVTKAQKILDKAKRELCETDDEEEKVNHDEASVSKKRVLDASDPMIFGTPFINDNPNAKRHKHSWEKKTKKKKTKKKRPKSHTFVLIVRLILQFNSPSFF